MNHILDIFFSYFFRCAEQISFWLTQLFDKNLLSAGWKITSYKFNSIRANPPQEMPKGKTTLFMSL